MKEIVLFEAEDGKRFETTAECQRHESALHAPDELLALCRVWDSNFDPLTISRTDRSWADSCSWVYAPTQACRDALNYFAEEWGLIYFFTEGTAHSTFIRFNEFLDIYTDIEKEINYLRDKITQMSIA